MPSYLPFYDKEKDKKEIGMSTEDKPSKKKSQLHEIIAVEPDLKGLASKIIDETKNTFTKKTEHFWGQTRTLNYLDEEREQENTSEIKPIVETVPKKLKYASQKIERYFDLLATKDKTNSKATADMTVDGEVLFENMPGTFYLTLESKLKELRTMYENIPTLDPGIDWVDSPSDGKDVYVVREPIISFRSEKQLVTKVVVQPTEHHPAQYEKWTEDKTVARIETTKKSAMLSSADKSTLLANIDTLLQAAKKARQRANSTEVEKVKVGKKIFEFIHKDVL